MKRALIVGGGPVGALSATHLASQGWAVTVLEKLGMLPTRPARDDPRAYCLMLGPRGLGALLQAGVDLAAVTAPSNGLLVMRSYGVNGRNGMRQETVIDPLRPERLMLYRDELNSHVLKEMQRLQSSIDLRLDTEVLALDLDKQHVTFAQGNKPTEVLQYDLLVGADGAGSVVRKAMAQILPPGFCRQRVASARYAVLPLPPLEPGTKTHSIFEKYDLKDGGMLYWTDRGDGDRRVSLSLPARVAEHLSKAPTAWDGYIDDKARLPKVPQQIRDGFKALLRGKPEFRVLSKWTLVSQLIGPKVVLLGDAAHSMAPTLGQACNCGLEDAQVFAGVMQACNGNVDAALPRYNAERLPDVQALLRLNQMWSARMGLRQEGISTATAAWMKCHQLLLGLTMFVRYLPHRVAPSLFPQPTLMQCLLGTVPYRRVFTEMYSVLAVLASLCLIPLGSKPLNSRLLHDLVMLSSYQMVLQLSSDFALL